MAKIGYSYLPRQVFNPETNLIEDLFTPYIPIRFSVNHSRVTKHIDALVDSGSDRNLFPLELGELLGINFSKMRPRIIFGIGNVQIKAYTSKINIWLDNTKYITEADFSPNQQTLLLGRQGFFNLFKTLTFDEKSRFLYIETF